MSETGFFGISDDQTYVESSSGKYSLGRESTVNNKLKHGDKVYFATYLKDGSVFANFVERYFENLDNLGAAKIVYLRVI